MSCAVQSKTFRETPRMRWRFTYKAITTAELLARLFDLAKNLKATQGRGDELCPSTEEVACYDALAENESAREAMESATLKLMARGLT